MFDGDWLTPFLVVFGCIAAVVGWGAIELVIWLCGKISVTWGAA